MSQDPNKKINRTFQCREALWTKFEQMAKELECSVDYLINDAMKQYARQRGYGGAAVGASPSMPPPPAGGPAHVAPPPPPAMSAPPPLAAPARSLTPPPAPPPKRPG